MVGSEVGTGVPPLPLEPRAEPAGWGLPAFLRPVSPPWVNRCLGIFDVLSAPPRNTPPPSWHRLWRPPFPHLRQQNRLMDQGARPEAWARGGGGPRGRGRGLGGVSEAPGAGGAESALPGLSVPPLLPHLLSPVSLRPSVSIYGLSTPPHRPAASMQTPSTQNLTLRDGNSSWQLRRNSSLQRPLSLRSVSHPIPSWPPACPQWKPGVYPENMEEGQEGSAARG